MPTISAIIPVYRSAEAALRTVNGLLACRHEGYELEVVVVDDGSGDGTVETIRASIGSEVTLVTHATNSGRAAARNTGMTTARGEWTLFIDADCLPRDDTFLLDHLDVTSRGSCSAGAVSSQGGGFWDRYQKLGDARRRRTGGAALFTSANFMVSREHMMRIGGFDPAFSGYGFEDRDLALRLEASGITIASNDAAAVIHDDRIDLATVCAKMVDAGSGNAALFAAKHPRTYRTLGYAALDARQSRLLRVVHRFIEPFRAQCIRILSPRLDGASRFFSLKAILVRLLVASSFLHGSTCPKDGMKETS